jgi:hypothetical protein
MENLMTGTAVFLAVVCGQPELLAILCLYLSLAALVAIAVAAVWRPLRIV